MAGARKAAGDMRPIPPIRRSPGRGWPTGIGALSLHRCRPQKSIFKTSSVSGAVRELAAGGKHLSAFLRLR